MGKKNIQVVLIILFFNISSAALKGVDAKNIFKVGERMIYALKWNNIRVGVNIVELEEIEKIKEKNAYHVVSRTYTQGLADVFFTVDDRVETFIDVGNYYPLVYKKDINEGKYHKKAVYNFNQDYGIVETPSGRYSTLRGIQDPLSILAYFRSLDIKVDDIIDIKYFAGSETASLKVNVVKKEVIKIPMGVYNTKLVSFSVGKKERDYLKNQVVLWIWFTDDDKRIPVLAKCNTAFGPVTGTLIDYFEGE